VATSTTNPTMPEATTRRRSDGAATPRIGGRAAAARSRRR
jgi:hypothetical protein